MASFSGRFRMGGGLCPPFRTTLRRLSAGSWWTSSALSRKNLMRVWRLPQILLHRKQTPHRCAKPENAASSRFKLILNFRKGLGNFLDVWQSWDIVIFEPGDFSGAVNDSDRAAGDAFVGQKDAVFFTNRATRLKIREQRILDAHLFGERFMRPGAVYAHTEHLRIELVETFHVIH